MVAKAYCRAFCARSFHSSIIKQRAQCFTSKAEEAASRADCTKQEKKNIKHKGAKATTVPLMLDN